MKLYNKMVLQQPRFIGRLSLRVPPGAEVSRRRFAFLQGDDEGAGLTARDRISVRSKGTKIQARQRATHPRGGCIARQG